MDEELEYVETSDIEELEEWNEPVRYSRTRSPSPEEGRASHPPFKKIKLFHDGAASLLALPCTPAKRMQTETFPETPAQGTSSQTPYLSQSSATVAIDHPTSQTHIAESPEAKVIGSNAEHPQNEARSIALFDHSQDPLLLGSPVQRVLNSSTPPRSPFVVDPPSPFLRSTTPPCTPMKMPKAEMGAHTANTARPPALRTPSRPLSNTPQLPGFLETADDSDDVLMDDGGPGIDALFSSPAKGADEGTVGSPYALPGSSPHSIGASSPASRSRSESPSPPWPPRSHSERSSVPTDDGDEPVAPGDQGIETHTPEEPPVIPPEKHYALRKRTILQEKPFTILDNQYLRQTKGYEEARVKVRSPSRGHRRHSEGRDHAEGDEEDRGFIADENEELSDGEANRNGRRRGAVDRTLDRVDGPGEDKEGVGRNKRKRSVADDTTRDNIGEADEDEEVAKEKRKRRALIDILDAIDEEPEDREEMRRRSRAERKQEKAQRKEKEQRQAIKNRTNTGVPSKQNHHDEGATSQPGVSSTISTMESVAAAQGHKQELENERMADPHPPTTPRVQQEDAISISSGSDVEVVPRPRFPLPSHGQFPVPSRSTSPVSGNHSDSGSDSEPTSTPDAPEDMIDVDLLFKMYPAGLARKLLRQALRDRRKKSRRAELSKPEEDGPLLPGQTRVRRRKHAVQREIKGDSESELDMPGHDNSRGTPSPSPARDHSPRLFQRGTTGKKRVFHPKSRGKKEDKGEYSSDSDSGLESIDKVAIQTLTTKKEKATTSNRPQKEVTLIDYMLATTLDFKLDVETKNQKKKKKKSGQSKPKLDIVTAGARGDPHSKQALLSNYQGYGRNRTQGTQRHNRQSLGAQRMDTPTVYISDEDDQSSEDDVEDDEHEGDGRPRQEGGGGGSNGSTRRQGGKRSKPRLRELYIFKPPGGGKAIIVSGARRDMVTVGIEEDAPANAALHPQPKIRQWEGPTYRRVRPPNRRPPLARQARTAEESRKSPEPLGPAELSSVPPEAEPEQTLGAHFPFFRESGVPRLPSGIAFASGTYINNGWLWEMLSCINPSPESPPPGPPISFVQEYDIPVEATVDTIAQAIDKALDGIFDFINEPLEPMPEPTPDQQRLIDHWTTISRNVCKGTWYCLSKLSDSDRSSLIGRAGAAVRVLIGRIEGLRLPHRNLDIRVFLANWTAVELSARIGEPMTRSARLTPSILTESIQLLVSQLLFFGLDSTMKPVLKGLEPDALSKYSLPSYTAELWARLIHLCCEYDKREAMKHNHVFWQFVQVSFKASLDAMTPDVGVYEDLWHSIFSLCAISQFTVHGMVRDQVNLPSSWELVRFICDEAFNPDGSEPVNHSAYIGLLLVRFLVLNERWKWKVVDVSPLVKLVVDNVFHPIKFGNLEGEKPEFPDFLRKPGKCDLSSWDSSDPAYVLLLKFIFKAAQEPTVKEPSIKKLISLAEPAASVQFDKHRPLQVEDMDKIINRITAAIVAVRLVPTKEYYANKVEQIRSAISFAKANHQTRVTLLRGLNYWSGFISKHQPQLGIHLLAPWLGDMANILAKEWRKWKARNGVKPEEDSELSLQAKGLLQAVHNAYMSSRVPEGDFLAQIKKFLVVTREEDEIQQPARRVLEIIVNRWYQAHPPLRPPELKEDQEESQDLYGDAFDDINWDGADIPEELGGPPAASQGQAQIDKSRQALKDAIDDRLQWFLYRSFKECFTTGRIKLGRAFMSAWVGCKLLVTQKESIEKEVDAMLNLLSSSAGEFTPSVKETIDIAFALALLQRHPMTYTVPHHADHFLASLMRSLTSPSGAHVLAADYVRAFLSVDYLQHPLLRGCQSLPQPSGKPPTYDFSTNDFPEIRIGMLDTILGNLNGLIESNQANADHFAEVVAESFSAMRQVLINWSGDSSWSKATYAAFCKEVMALLLQYTTLAERPCMEFWVKWSP